MSSSQSISRGQRRGLASISNTKLTINTISTKSTGPYDRNFQQNLTDGGVYPHAYRYPDGRVPAKPNNWKEINQRLTQPRPSLSKLTFSEDAHETFIQADADAFKEKQITTLVIPIIEGEIRDIKCVSGGIPFTNLNHLTDGTLVPGNPDLYYGARPEQLNRRVRNELSGRIIPSTQDNLPMAPNFFLAAKGPDGTVAVAGRQACYDGALGARGIQSLQSYGQVMPVYDANAYTITSVYHDGQLKMYTTHPAQLTGPEDPPEYFMTRLNTWGMTGNPETFRQGATAYRNARDWAKERRDQFIEAANTRMSDTSTEPQCLEPSGHIAASGSAAGLVVDGSSTSADELTPEEHAYRSSSKRRRMKPSESNQ